MESDITIAKLLIFQLLAADIIDTLIPLCKKPKNRFEKT